MTRVGTGRARALRGGGDCFETVVSAREFLYNRTAETRVGVS
jgi:hypothetical protein